jgi:alanine racemase
VSRTEALINLDAVRSNVATLKRGTPAEVMAVVKADGYGHGLLPVARAALAGGASWLGTAIIDEALLLRAAGIQVPILAWLWSPSESVAVAEAIRAGIDLSVSSTWALDTVVAAARDASQRANVHLKIDTGLSRNGAYIDDWPDLVAAAIKAETGGEVAAVGVWSHFAYADDPGHPTVARQLERFREGVALAERSGLRPRLRHLANSAATLTNPDTHFDLVRPGIAVYGLSPVPTHGDFDLVPAMSLRAEAALVKRVQPGEGVSYGHIYHTAAATTLVLVPLGYADGIPRHAGNRAPVQVGGARFRISGRVCMDQFVIDVGDQAVVAGDTVLLFGTGLDGEPTAQDWADAADTIHYEIVTRVGPRVPRRYVGTAG